jgi:hypothetical protein
LHVFCRKCIQYWLHNNRNCPTCKGGLRKYRRRIGTIDEHPDYAGHASLAVETNPRALSLGMQEDEDEKLAHRVNQMLSEEGYAEDPWDARGGGKAATAGEAVEEVGLGRIVACCTTAHPLCTGSTNMFGASFSETAMRPNPRRRLRRTPR